MSTLSVAISSRAAQALRHSSHPALRALIVEETEQAIVISGRVSSYYLKQLAQEVIMQVRTGRDLVNRVTVEKVERLK
jgi:hypothetical protein